MDINKALDYLNNKDKVPKEMSDKLKAWQDVYYDMSLHIAGAKPRYRDLSTSKWIEPIGWKKDYQDRFDYKLMSRHPREPLEIREWRYSQYRPITKAPFSQAIEIIVGALFQDSNYSITIQDEKDSEYIYENKWSGYDLIGYYANKGVRNIMEDPNGLFVRMPSKPMYEQESERVEVDIWFVNSPDIVYYNDNHLVFKHGNYAYYMDSMVIWRFTYDNKQYVISKEDTNGYYAHLFGKLPVTIAGGTWNTQGYYDSYFDKSKALADEFISVYSAAQMVDKEASHPYIVAQQEDCEVCNGQGAISEKCNKCDDGCDYCNNLPVQVSCNECHGSGTSSKSPGMWMMVAKSEDVQSGGIKFVNPDTSINKLHRETVKTLYEQIKESLHLFRTDQAESGAAKAIDQEWQYKFLSKVSNHIFDGVIYDTLLDITSYRNVTTDGDNVIPEAGVFEIIKPTEFNIQTKEDLRMSVKEESDAGLPVNIRLHSNRAYIDKAYNGDKVMLKTDEFLTLLDPLYLKTDKEIMTLLASGLATNEMAQIHLNLPLWLKRLINRKGIDWYLSKTDEEIKIELQEEFNSVLPPTDIDGIA